MATRRELLKASLMLPVAAAQGPLRGLAQAGPRVVVIGAGAFGGWTALELRRRGARVTLIDAWGPGNSRASSGGETRVIRATYGTRTIYTRMAIRAMELWRAHDARWQRGFFRPTGALWMFGADASFGRASAAALRAANMPIEELTTSEAARRFSQIAFDDSIKYVLWEPVAGYLLARRACEHVVERFVAEGGEYRQAAVPIPFDVPSKLRSVALEHGGSIEADVFVFACGPWLGKLFPDAIGTRVMPTRQEVYYFGTPRGDSRFNDPAMPVWVDYRDRVIYGISGNANRGFKVADDTPGPAFDPTSGTRDATAAGVAAARAFLALRFPALAGAPLLGSEVCQYEASPDSHFIIDRHPHAANVWIAGGGSGHGYKMGPALGELLASCVLGTAAPDPQFALARLAARPPRLTNPCGSAEPAFR
ncbi:MAG TPA: FAD-dependent oxidoreductase [Vicinamibacterales bacterium]|nr:FAD-dependent oxidoreductase [Vicinamibacterales bacterium]